MNFRSQFGLWSIALAMASLGPSVRATAPPVVVVETLDGRTVSGKVDARTDGERLWLRRESATILYSTQVAWEAIETATLEGEPIDRTKLAERAPSLVQPAPEAFISAHLSTKDPDDALPEPGERAPGVAGDALPEKRRQVVDVAVAAWLIDFDRDVEHDGVALCISPLDKTGTQLPVRGSLTARLIVQRYDAHTGRRWYENAQRWRRMIEVDDFADGVASFRLPFRTVAPEHDLELRSQALLNVRLSAAGHGNYESSTGIAIRPLHPFRDTLQLHRGSRFAENELVAPVDSALPLPVGQRAAPWTPYHVQGVSF